MLTHEEAACLRCLFVAPWVHAPDLGALTPSELWPPHKNGGQIFDFERARELLVEYDAHYVTVSRWQLERALQLLSENLLDAGEEIEALRNALETK